MSMRVFFNSKKYGNNDNMVEETQTCKYGRRNHKHVIFCETNHGEAACLTPKL